MYSLAQATLEDSQDQQPPVSSSQTCGLKSEPYGNKYHMKREGKLQSTARWKEWQPDSLLKWTEHRNTAESHQKLRSFEKYIPEINNPNTA